MDRGQFLRMNFDELMEYAIETYDGVTTEEQLKDFAIHLLQDDNFGLALHIINAIYNNPYDTIYYRYSYDMGTLETPTPITEKEDVEDIVIF